MSPEGETLDQSYQVVARRYRPQSFESLVGQDQVATALSNAIKTNRVGHAYLFTGARGVGKTSSARIFAKCLNCVTGPTSTPCGECDICLGVNDGQDVDVLEIDGASNRGIDEIRELRSHINVRPSRSRYKIYIIDEVHMLTPPAFNALLKTLEEPPEHVKFIFCTTDPEKIPITVLSRCQRFDFAPVEAGSIEQRLKEICETEGFEADQEALQLLARRASGSMRDSQSLLEQLLSFCDGKISLDDVNRLLGTADLSRVQGIVSAIEQRDGKSALQQLEQALKGGVDGGQLASQLVAYFRDLLVVSHGCGVEQLMIANPSDFESLEASSRNLGPDTTMACLQILDEVFTRVRFSPHAVVLLEMAIIRCCRLQDLDAIAAVIKMAKDAQPLQIQSGSTPSDSPTSAKAATTPVARPKKNDPPAKLETTRPSAESADPPPTKTLEPESPTATPAAKKKDEENEKVTSGPRADVHAANVESIWKRTLERMGDMAADYASNYKSLAISAPNCLAVTLDSFYKEKCEVPAVKKSLEDAFARETNQRFRIDFVSEERLARPERKAPVNKRQQMREMENHPLVKKAIETFDGEIVDIRNAP